MQAPPDRSALARTLAEAVAKAHQENRPVRIASALPLVWESFYAFKPYTSPSTMNAMLGFPGTTTYSDETGTYCLLVFTRARTIVNQFKFPRYQGDCSTLPRPGPWQPGDASFTVATTGKTTGGQPFLTLRPPS